MADNTTGREAAGQVQVAEEILNSFLSLAPKKDFDLVNTIFSRRNNRIWIFGAAGIGISIKRWLTERGCTVYSFCDNDPEKVGKAVDGIPCRARIAAGLFLSRYGNTSTRLLTNAKRRVSPFGMECFSLASYLIR